MKQVRHTRQCDDPASPADQADRTDPTEAPGRAGPDGDVTRLLRAYGGGERDALDQLLPLVYDDLRRIARRQGRHHLAGQTLNPTGLVHEAYLKLAGQSRLEAQDRAHFFAICARAMRQVIISLARQRNAAKRGSGQRVLTLVEEVASSSSRLDDLLALEEALGRLEARDEDLARVVECRFFAGLSEPETARALDLPLRTVQRMWTRARAWLRRDLSAPAVGGENNENKMT